MTNKQDTIYKQEHQGRKKFRFDQEVAGVFADMISRSVPGYQQILEMLPTLIRNKSAVAGNYYDLGCSLGAGMLALAAGCPNLNTRSSASKRNIIGVDNSTAMLEQAQSTLADWPYHEKVNYHFRHDNIQETQIEDAAIVLMNFTLQFIAPAQRDELIQTLCEATGPGGLLVLSEKVCFSDKATNQALIELHHQFKSEQGYSELEIAQKRDAIENVLIPESLDTHTRRLEHAGYRIVTPWIQNLQFVSILAIK